MILISDGKRRFTIKDKEIKQFKNNLYFDGINRNSNILLTFNSKGEFLQKIKKCMPSSSDYVIGDTIKEYKNKIMSANKIIVNNEEYKELLKLYKNMNKKDKYRDKVIIDSYSQLIAYECYNTSLFDEITDDDIDYIYKEVCCCCLYLNEKSKYKKEILTKAFQILKTKYNLDICKIINGGTK